LNYLPLSKIEIKPTKTSSNSTGLLESLEKYSIQFLVRSPFFAMSELNDNFKNP
jgi:hypothetical protein